MAVKMNPVNFVLAQNSAVILHAAKADETLVRGLQGMGLLLGFTMETQTVAEMGRRIALVVPSGGTYEPTDINYNFVPGDPTLEEFRDAAINSTKLDDVRLYVKQGCDFTAPDKISDPGSGLYVGSMGDPSVDSPNGLYTGTLQYMAGGAFVIFVAHAPQGTDFEYSAVSNTLTITSGDFTTAAGGMGFEVGDTAILDYGGAAGTDEPYFLKIASVSALEIAFETGVGDSDLLVAGGDFTGTAKTQLHAATPLVVTGYSGLDSCADG